MFKSEGGQIKLLKDTPMPQVSNRTGETLLLHNKHRLGVCPCRQMIVRQHHKGEIMQYERAVGDIG